MYKVMLVDDEPAMIDSLKRLLENDGNFTVVCDAFMVSFAKELLNHHNPDVLVTDMRMPGGNGIELIKYVATALPNCVIVAISGYDNFDYVRDAFVYGAFDYILKPVIPSKFKVFLEKLKLKLEEQRGTSQKFESCQINNHISNTKLIEEIEQFITSTISMEHSLDSVCKKFLISQPFLSKLFRKHKECSFNEFLISLRISKAKKYLLSENEQLIASIAEETGFKDQFYFSKVFKSAVGLTPTEFKKMNMRKEE